MESAEISLSLLMQVKKKVTLRIILVFTELLSVLNVLFHCTGKISGWVELSVGLEEDSKRLYGPTPYECPAPPPDPFNLSTIELHISRLSDFVEDVLSLVSKYQYAVSWKSPLLTGFSFALFLAFTIKFDSEYVGW